jgi:deazaflavin-dependent oxidoreductase (nitroreductase family)
MRENLNKTEQFLRQGFKQFNRFMLLLWRLGLGVWLNAWPKVFGRIMVLTHTGRKSGKRYRTPVNYAIVDEQIYCTAGFGSMSDWYRNILANPNVEIWLPQGWWRGVVDEVIDPQVRLTLLRQVLIASGFATYAAGINPHTISDDDLEKVTSDYKLLHIQQAQACTGDNGPGDLSWVWPLATMLLLPLALRRRKKQ